MRDMPSSRKLLTAAIASLTLAACGGGGGDSAAVNDNNNPDNPSAVSTVTGTASKGICKKP